MRMNRERLAESLQNVTAALLRERNPEGYWEGRLSSSALSTATAVCALAIVDRRDRVRSNPLYAEIPFTELIEKGLAWLANHQNQDGGWGDTPISGSNISTTILSWAVFAFADSSQLPFQSTVRAAETWIRERAGGIEPQQIAQAILKKYGNDRTFSVPILTHCALAGRLGSSVEAWRCIIQLPFELAACPHSWFAALRLPVVSYALPALIAIGRVRHHYRPAKNPLMRFIRWAAKKRAMHVLREIQPGNGGFLEAIPLTSFVAMSLAGCNETGDPVVRKALRFILDSVQQDGSWQIDSNLATWITTLSVNALKRRPQYHSVLPQNERLPILNYLLRQQHRCEHPYTHAAPGGWAWTHLPGGVPDADDTSGALLALYNLGCAGEEIKAAAGAGIAWLLSLQNRDGGVPTFCRGWSNLPFDRSCPDITAHALQSMNLWKSAVHPAWKNRLLRFQRRAIQYLIETQQMDGSWSPLWFGNEKAPGRVNKTYGTAQVLIALSQLDRDLFSPLLENAIQLGVDYLLHSQNREGGWGGSKDLFPSIEETSLAALALLTLYNHESRDEALPRSDIQQNILPCALRGVEWVIDRTKQGTEFPPAAIGFYFAELWYYEKLYPIIYTLAALSEASRVFNSYHGTD